MVEDDKKVILKDYLRKNKINKGDNFNTWFNEQFEKGRVLNEEQERGYGDWLRSNEDVDEEVKISHAQMGEEIEKMEGEQQQQLRQKGGT